MLVLISVLFFIAVEYSYLTNSTVILPFVTFLKDPSADAISLFQNLGFALITILIPFGIAIFEILLSTRSKKNNIFPQLDLKTILGVVLDVKNSSAAFGLVFMGPLFLEFNYWMEIKTFFFISYLWGLLVLMLLIKNLYLWISSDDIKWKFRYRYLKELAKTKNIEDQKIVWSEIWEKNYLNYKVEEELFFIFIDNTNSLCVNKQISEREFTLACMNFSAIFIKNIKNRKILIYHNSEFLEKLIHLYYQYWELPGEKKEIFRRGLYENIFKSLISEIFKDETQYKTFFEPIMKKHLNEKIEKVRYIGKLKMILFNIDRTEKGGNRINELFGLE